MWISESNPGNGQKELTRSITPMRAETSAEATRVWVEYRAANLPPTAERILEAAQRVLAQDGYAGLTLRSIAAESGENQALIRYYFGDRAGLISALIDSLWHGLNVEAGKRWRALPASAEHRIPALIDIHQALSLSTHVTRGHFELLPHVLRDVNARASVAGLYDIWLGMGVEVLEVDDLPQPLRRPMSVLLMAVDDGVSLQRLVSGNPEPHQRAWSLLRAAAAECGRVGGFQSESAAIAQASTVPTGTSSSRCSGVDLFQSGISNRLADYAPAAQRFLKAARRLLSTKGIGAVTFEATGRLAGQPSSSVAYYFGNKAGLIRAIVETILTDEYDTWIRRYSRSVGMRRQATDPTAFTFDLLRDTRQTAGFWDLVPVLTQDETMRQMASEHLDRLQDVLVAVHSDSSATDNPLPRDWAALLLATYHGLSIQEGLYRRDLDLYPIADIWHRLFDRASTLGAVSGRFPRRIFRSPVDM
jgi:AcrR family transcriptional regulator